MTVDYASNLRGNEAQLKRAMSQHDGRFFLERVIGYRPDRFYGKQVDIMDAILNHPKSAVVGANGSGKDWAAGQALLMWMYAFRSQEPIVVVSGPTHRQVRDVVFSESRKAWLLSKTPLGGRFLPVDARWNMNPANAERSYAVGYSVQNPLNLQGIHSPKLLVIITEAHNVPQAEIEALDRLNPTATLMTGNALSAGGEFFEAFHSLADQFHTIHISAFDTPNVQAGRVVIPGLVTNEIIEGRLARYGEESPQYIASVKGEFPDTLEGVVVSLRTIREAIDRTLAPGPTDRTTLAVDVGYMGEDATVIYARRGDRCRQVWEVHRRDTQYVAGHVGRMAAQDPSVEEIIIDATGVGAGVYDRLREDPPVNANGIVSIRAFKGGERPVNRKDYENAISEAYLEFAKACRSGIVDLDDNRPLVAEITSRKTEIRGDRRERIEPKERYKKRVGRSPDHADALVMLYSPKRNRWGPVE